MNRRMWLAATVGMATWPEIRAAQQHAHAAVKAGRRPAVLDRQAAADIEALTAEIVPTTATPGAREAGVVHFIDRALATFAREHQAAYREGLDAVRAKRAAMFPAAASVAALSSAERIALLQAVESTPFFELLRTHTMMGFLADPRYGGNPAGGYRTLGYQPAHRYQPPFGWYDDKANGGEN